MVYLVGSEEGNDSKFQGEGVTFCSKGGKW